MAGIDWSRARSILERVLDVPEAEQEARLVQECAGDELLLGRLRELLEQDRSETDFLRTLELPGPEPPPESAIGTRIGPWRLAELLGSGGMGTVWRAERADGAYEQTVALKVARMGHATVNLLARLERERAFLARLEHPGIARLIDGGATEDGAPYFALEYVDGLPIDRYADAERLSLRQRIELFVRALEAVSYAHVRGVVHRDLKPANLLVARDGSPKLLDFGIAKLVTDDEEAASLTLTGERMMTPRYASPEQVLAQPISASADVYALGVMLYELLTGSWPYRRSGASMVELQLAICHDMPLPASRVVETQTAETETWGEPADTQEILSLRRTTPTQLRRELAGELDWVLAKALAKEPERRYATVALFAQDLSNYLAGRPVLARPASLAYRARKFTRRHRVLVGATLAVVAALGTGLVLSVGESRRARAAELEASLQTAKALRAEERTAQANVELARKSREAEDAARAARARAEEVLRLSARQDYADLVQEADALWPAHPARSAELEHWIERAGALAADLPLHRAQRDELRALALPQDAEQRAAERASHPELPRLRALETRIETLGAALAAALDDAAAARLEAQLAQLEDEQARLDELVEERRDWRFPPEHARARWWHNQVGEVIAELESLVDVETGLLSESPAAASARHGWSVPRRLAAARALEAAHRPGGEHRARWAAAQPQIAAAYDGLELAPQMGLVPLGPDPHSGLWEFWHVQTGAEPRRDASGELQPSPESGVVLVLLRGGTFWMGAQRGDPAGPNFDPLADPDEGPPHRVTLSPFLLSKYELTQAQWLFATGANPSYTHPSNGNVSLAHPVEQVSWDACRTVLARLDLALPSEAQWEYGARAGTHTPWWTGLERETLAEARAVNVADASARRANAPWPAILDWPELDDGFVIHGPAGSLSPNAFGLHEVHGGVWEWCADVYSSRAYRRGDVRDPLVLSPGASVRVGRGGSYQSTADVARSASRMDGPVDTVNAGLGVRPARAIR